MKWLRKAAGAALRSSDLPAEFRPEILDLELDDSAEMACMKHDLEKLRDHLEIPPHMTGFMFHALHNIAGFIQKSQ